MENSESGEYMIYAMITTISAAHPTATPIPTPTNFPIEIAKNLTDLPWGWEIAGVIITAIGVLATVCLGYYAWKASENANKASDIANTISQMQIEREEEMRQRENKIAVLDKAFEIYNYFFEYLAVIGEPPRVHFINRKNEILYLSKMLFKEDTYKIIETQLELLLSADMYYSEHDAKSDTSAWFTRLSERFRLTNKYNNKQLNELTVLEQKRVIQYFIKNTLESIFEKYRLNL